MSSYWILIDDSHPLFDRWQHSAGFTESFWKGQNPNRLYAYEIFGELIKDYCMREGITQNDLADRLDITSGTLSSYITGRHKPSEEFITRLESITGLTIA